MAKRKYIRIKPLRLMTVTCSTCLSVFYTYPSRIKAGNGKYCTRTCAWRAQIGKPHPNNRRKMTEEEKERLRLIRPMSGEKNHFFGRQHSQNTKNKISISHKGKKLSIEHIKKCLRRGAKSSLEIKALSIIDNNNLPYRFVGDGKFFIERKNPDFINVNGKKIAVEVFYRRHKDKFRGGLKSWKKEREEIFKKYGWEILFFDESQVNNKSFVETLKGGYQNS